MKNWPVIFVLLAVLLGLFIAGYINKSRAQEDNNPHGCLKRNVTLPEFIVLQSCAREKGLQGELINKIYVVRKSMIYAIVHVKDRGNECSRVEFGGTSRALVYGSIEELTLRVQPGYVDYGACGPAADSFMRMLEDTRIKLKEENGQ